MVKVLLPPVGRLRSSEGGTVYRIVDSVRAAAVSGSCTGISRAPGAKRMALNVPSMHESTPVLCACALLMFSSFTAPF